MIEKDTYLGNVIRSLIVVFLFIVAKTKDVNHFAIFFRPSLDDSMVVVVFTHNNIELQSELIGCGGQYIRSRNNISCWYTPLH